MQFVRGNLALRDHAENGEDVHLFEQEPDGPSLLRAVGRRRLELARRCARPERQPSPGDRVRPRRSRRRARSADTAGGGDRRERPALDDAARRASHRGRLGRSASRRRPPSQAQRLPAQRRPQGLRAQTRRRDLRGLRAAGAVPDDAGRPYLEPHHTRRLSDGGPDDYHHVIALCPTCHRRVHHGEDGATYNADLVAKLATIESA